MSEAFSSCMTGIGKYFSAEGFLDGAFFGAVVALILVFIAFRVMAVINGRRLSNITVESGIGTVTVTSDAVSDLVATIAAEFKPMKVVKSYLYKREGVLSLIVVIDFTLGGRNLPVIVPEFQKMLTDALRAAFGIDNVSSIYVRVRRTLGSLDVSSEKAVAAEPVNPAKKEPAPEPPKA